MKIFAKILAVPGLISMKMAGLLITALGKVSSILAGPFLVFVIGCCIYSAFTGNWRNLAILAAVGGACVLFYLLIGLILGGIDIACSRMKNFIRS